MTNGKATCICENPACPGLERLREFAGWEDLTAHCGEVTIVRWINELAEKKERERFTRQKYGAKQRAALRFMRQQLSPDELAEIERQAELRAEEKMNS